MTAEKRVDALHERLAAEGLGAIALTQPMNIRYCTGFSGVFDEEAAHVALVTDCAAVLITDSRYFDAMGAAAAGTEWVVALSRTSLADSLAEHAARLGVKSLGLETSLPYKRFRALEAALDVDVAECDGWVERLRQVKDAEEIARIQAAQDLTDAAYEHLLAHVIRAGASEREIALELEFHLRREGSDGLAFPPIVASGPNSVKPHATPSERALAPGDLVVLDFGARVDGYCADMTRTVCVGPASERQREIYDCVLAANLAGNAAVRAGGLGRELDAAARSLIEERGFGEYFGHGLGHGVGLEVHELPGIGARSEGEVPLGAVITIEPGIYVPGYGGVRIEDLVVVEEGRGRILTRSSKDLLEL